MQVSLQYRLGSSHTVGHLNRAVMSDWYRKHQVMGRQRQVERGLQEQLCKGEVVQELHWSDGALMVQQENVGRTKA